MNIQAIIFDLDGVIVNTDYLHYLGWKQISDEENIHFDREINNRLRGVSRMESLEIILENATKNYTEDEKVKLATKKNEYYVEFLSELSKDDILEGVLKTLESIKSKGIKIAIGSSSKNTKTILRQIGLDNYFAAIADGTDIKNSKPDPEVFIIAAKKLGVLPKYCAVVEDAKVGIDAANAAGMISVAVSDAQSYDKANFKLSKISNLENVLNI